ncbi:MAG: pyrroline-5-carboxylate reductase [Rhodospirillales bacterium]|nr:pyrroline-5-carboxylate reductase [Rhodospirillales bacterium]
MRPLILAGAGKMGGALLEGWIAKGLSPDAIVVVEPQPEIREATHKRFGVKVLADASAVAGDPAPEVIVLAVKPQVMDGVAAGYKRFAGPGVAFLSIAAGKTIRYFEERLGPNAAIVRAMPNTPAAVRRGIAVLCANARVSDGQRRRCQELLEAVGEACWVDDETLIDAVTAVSGSGPAYVFLLAECLAEAGIDAGLAPDLAKRLARATVAGAGELLHRAPEPAEVLRKNVTSPGGTTAAALEVLMGDDGLKALLRKAVAAATRRSRELAS